MRVEFIASITLIITIGLVWSSTHRSIGAGFDSLEQEAMASIGYTVTTKTTAYPNNLYAMPEPYSSTALVNYTYTGPKNFALNKIRMASIE